MSKIIRNCFFLVFALTSIWSCKNEVAQKMGSKPSAMGRINNVVIVADQNITDSNLADTISYYFESPYPMISDT